MNRYYAVLAVLLMVTVISCSDDSDTPLDPTDPVDDSFSLAVLVNDSIGNPLPDIRISAWNHPSFARHITIGGSSKSSMSYTEIQFELFDSSHINVSVYNLNDELEMTIIDDTLLAQIYVFAMAFEYEPSISQVFRVILQGEGLTSGIAFADTALAYCWQYDPNISIIGYTNVNGLFLSTDSLAFPSTFNLPQLQRTNERAWDLGLYDITDTVHFVLTDTVADSSMSLDVVISNGPNEIQVQWDPTDVSWGQGQWIGDGRKLPQPTAAGIKVNPVEMVIYPNPFN